MGDSIIHTEIQFPQSYLTIWNELSPYTMIPKEHFIENLALIDYYGSRFAGAFVECGTWKGGMSAALMKLGGMQHEYHFFDSFEGLPPVQPIDGAAAAAWQADTESPNFFNNCTASFEEFQALISKQPIPKHRVHIYKGWFSDTLLAFPRIPISVLRLGCDWYEPTKQVLESLYPQLAIGGVLLLNDYMTWDGCSRAVHEYLTHISSVSRIQQTPLSKVPYIVKMDTHLPPPIPAVRGYDAYESHGIWTTEEAMSDHQFDEGLARGILELFPENPGPTADLGCGPGFYCAFFSSHGWDVQGYEGTPDMTRFGKYDRITTQDLSVRNTTLPQYTVVLSLEVGEHIPKEYETNFLDNVCSMAGRTLILSWAVPGQGGYGHFNCQPNKYIIEQVASRGLTLNVPKSNCLRNASTLSWFKNTLMLFERPL